MALAALVVIDDDGQADRASGRAARGGLDWGAFRLRQAVRAGATHLVVIAARVPSSLVRAIDTLRREGISATLVRDADAAGDLFHPEECVLLLAGETALAPAALALLVTTPVPAVLCVAPGDADAGLERIDATACWAGAALIDGAMVRAAAATVGDWDLGSMLLRAAVQRRAVRIVPPAVPSGGSLFDGVIPTRDGWGARWLIAPVARGLATRLGTAATPMVRWAALAVGGAFVGALGLAAGGLIAPAFALVIVALVIAATGTRAAQAYGLRGIAMTSLLDAGAAAVLIVAVMTTGEAALGIGAMALTAFGFLSVRLPAELPPWRADAAGQACLLMIGSAFGSVGFAAALALAAIHAFVGVAYAQNRLAAP